MLKYGDYVALKEDMRVKGFITRSKERGMAHLASIMFNGESKVMTTTEPFTLSEAHRFLTPMPHPLEKELKT